MAVLGGNENYRVEWDENAGGMFGNEPGKWVAKGPGFFSGGQHSTKKQAVKAARMMADKGDTLKIMNKDGSHNRTVEIQG